MSIFPDTSTNFGTRVDRRLQTTKAIWLTTVGKDGTPQPNPVWFSWRGDEILVYNQAGANRLAHLAVRPRVSLHLDGDGYGSDIVILTGSGEVLPDHPGPHEDEAYVQKYAADMIRISGDVKRFGEAYPVAIRIVVDRVRGY